MDRRFRWIPEVMGQEGDKSYNLRCENAPTYWADEGRDLTINLASKGSSGCSVHILYTDEHRLGDQSSSFAEVAPKT